MRKDHDYDLDGTPYVVVERHHDAGIGTFLLGLAIGAGAALLFAPRSGADTRELIKSRARDAGNSARERVDAMTSSMADSMSERFETVRSAVRRRREDLLDAVDAGRSAAHEARVELERKLAERKAGDPARSTRMSTGDTFGGGGPQA